MSFLFGKSGSQSNVNPASADLQQTLAKYLKGRGFEGLFTEAGVDPKVIQPYLDLFSQQNSRNLAQAKESAGNLTGSGVGNIIGQQAGKASTEQGAFLADLSERMRQADRGFLLNAILGILGSPSAGQTPTYTPGLLDYGVQGLSAAAPFLAEAGGGGGGVLPGPNAPPGISEGVTVPNFDPFSRYR